MSHYWSAVRSGADVDFLEPDPDQIHLVDIAYHLARIYRYCGASDISVAEHSVLLSYQVPRELALDALMHDSPEYVLGDLAPDVKALIKGYKELENRLYEVICKKFGLIYPLPPLVKEFDKRINANEKRDILLPCKRKWSVEHDPLPNVDFQRWSPVEAEANFIRRFYSLKEITYDLTKSPTIE